MIVKIKGVEGMAGSFTSKTTGQLIDYNNIHLYALRPLSPASNGRLCFGEATEDIKIKNDANVIRSIFSKEMTSKDFIEMVDKEYNVFYDRNGKVDMIYPVDSAGKQGA